MGASVGEESGSFRVLRAESRGRKERENVIRNKQTQAWVRYEGYEKQITSGIGLSGTEIATGFDRMPWKKRRFGIRRKLDEKN
jgi:hypothetical protein